MSEYHRERLKPTIRGVHIGFEPSRQRFFAEKQTALEFRIPDVNISVEGKPIQQVDSMVYLGYMATEDGKCDKEIKRRIGIARTAYESMAKILTPRNISIELRSRIAKCYIWSTLLYGAETWTL